MNIKIKEAANILEDHFATLSPDKEKKARADLHKLAMKRRTKKKKKLTLEQAARRLTAILWRHLSTLTPEEREARVSAFERRVYGEYRCKGGNRL